MEGDSYVSQIPFCKSSYMILNFTPICHSEVKVESSGVESHFDYTTECVYNHLEEETMVEFRCGLGP